MIGCENFLSFETVDNENVNVNLKIINNKLNIKIKDKIFDFYTLFKLSRKIRSYLNKYSENTENIIIISSDDLEFREAGVFFLFETLFYYFCKESKFKKIKFKFKNLKIFLDNDLNARFLHGKKNLYILREEFIQDYEKFNISLTNFRKIVRYSKENKKNVSALYTDLALFLKDFSINDSFKEQFIETLVELVGNANEHAGVDCLLDLTVDPIVEKNTNKEFYNVSVIVANFSNILLGNGIREKIKVSETERGFLKDLKMAYNNHKNFFDETYTEDDFFNISTFQWRFSGRKEIIDNNGGTGLTTLLKFLIASSELDSCYVFSGNNIIVFKQEFLHENSLKHVGFNKEQDYLSARPDKNCVSKMPFFLNGTLYNFDFVIEAI